MKESPKNQKLQESNNDRKFASAFKSGLSRIEVAARYGVTVKRVDKAIRRCLLNGEAV